MKLWRMMLLALTMSLLSSAMPITSLTAQEDESHFPLLDSWSARERGATRSVAWGDVDNDGDLDLAVGNDGQLNRVYLNVGDGLQETAAWSSAESNLTRSVAWGDVDNDGDLDLAVGNRTAGRRAEPNQIYRNCTIRQSDDGCGDDDMLLSSIAVWIASENGSDTLSIAWGDLDNDGDLDLAVGNRLTSPDQIYRNCTFRNSGDGCEVSDELLSADPIWSSADKNTDTFSLAWGDVDNDGQLDLVTGPRIYRNVSSILNREADDWRPKGSDSIRSHAWGDVDGDGDLDLAIGNSRNENRVYLNTGMGLEQNAEWTAGKIAPTYSVAWGDVDSDGDLDLAVGNERKENQLYLNNAGKLAQDPAWDASTQQEVSTYSVAWGDVDNDGDLDLAAGTRLYRNTMSLLATAPVPLTNDSSTITATAWGDIDRDGDLDLAVGNQGQPNRLYRNDSGVLSDITPWPLTQNYNTKSLAWGDMDGDGDLDLAVANSLQQNQVYRNDNGLLSPNAVWFSPEADPSKSLAWGDVDSDGDLDLAVGNTGRPNRLYLNSGTTLSSRADWSPDADNTNSLAWGDVDGDGDLDLAIGNTQEPSKIYLNREGKLETSASWSTFETDPSTSIAWGDVDGDGDLDLAIGNNGQSSRLYLNEHGQLGRLPIWASVEADNASSLAWGDVDNDGDLDLAVGNYNAPSRIYRNENGLLSLSAVWVSAQHNTASMAWVDIDRDGDLDLALGNTNEPSVIYKNRRASTGTLTPPIITLSQPLIGGVPLPGSAGLATALLISSPTIAFSYTLRHAQSLPAVSVRGQYSLDGGGKWYPAVPALGTVTTALASSPEGTVHSYSWDIFASGMYGQTDRAVFRLVVNGGDPGIGMSGPEIAVANRLGSYSLPGPFLYGTTSTSSLPFRLRGTIARVVNDRQEGVPNALVYRLPSTEEDEVEPQAAPLLNRLNGKPILSDAQGYVKISDPISPTNGLVALQPISSTDSFTMYFTSATPISAGIGLDFQAVDQPGIQTLTILSANPLILFNLSVSLEWDARNDPLFISQLGVDIQRTSELLYDWSDGQVALGDITIHQDREEWDNANIRIYATNRLRPNADKGGIVPDRSQRVDPDWNNITYRPGQLRMGAIWNRYGDATANLGDDWARTLAHELGHYALYLDDNYLGLDEKGRLITVEEDKSVEGTHKGCPSVMSDPYREDYSEFHPGGADWEDVNVCRNTLSWHETGRSDWQTITKLYNNLSPGFKLNPPSAFNANPGPNNLPLTVTRIQFVEPRIAKNTLLEPMPTVFLVDPADEQLRPLPGSNARGILFRQTAQGEQIIDLGRPNADQLIVRGARKNDRVCLYELAIASFDPDISDDKLSQSRLGCTTLTQSYQQLQLSEVTSWRPDIQLTPVDLNTLQITVTLAADFTLKAQLYPSSAVTQDAITLSRHNGVYSGTFTSPITPTFEGFVRVWAEGAAPLREVVTDFRIGGNPGEEWLDQAPRGNPGFKWSARAPVLSSDGQAIYYTQNTELAEGEFYALMSTGSAPPPPSWAIPVGMGYRLTATNGAPALEETSLTISYLAEEVPPGQERSISIYYYDSTGESTWRKLADTKLNPRRNEATTVITRTGLYQLMTSIDLPLSRQGWNLIYSYPGATRVVSEALEAGNEQYTTVYGYDAGDLADPWKVYGRTVPEIWWSVVNDLGQLKSGESYWFYVDKPVIIPIKGGNVLTAQVADNVLAFPPATYYGWLEPGLTGGRAPQKDQIVRAMIDRVECGTTTTRHLNDTPDSPIVFSINVYSAASKEGCGTAGSQVTFIVSGVSESGEPVSYQLPIAKSWDNAHPQRIGKLLPGQLPGSTDFKLLLPMLWSSP